MNIGYYLGLNLSGGGMDQGELLMGHPYGVLETTYNMCQVAHLILRSFQLGVFAMLRIQV